MSEHIWVEEAMGSYLAGGLDRAERERLEEHVAGCADCARELEQARDIDGQMEGLFAPVRPQPALEDRLIQSIRQQPLRRGFRPLSRWGKRIVAAAAILLFAVTGAGVSSYLEEGGEATAAAYSSNQLKQVGAALHDVSGSMGELGTDADGFLTRFQATNTIDHFPPALASIVRAPSRVHTSMTGGLIGGRKMSGEYGKLMDGTSLHGLNFGVENLWDAATGRNGVAFSPDGKNLASAGQKMPLGTDWGGEANSAHKKIPPSALSIPKKRLDDASAKQQSAEQNITYSLEKKAEVSVPGQTNLGALAGTQISNSKVPEGGTVLLGGLRTVLGIPPGGKTYFRPGEVFAKSEKKSVFADQDKSDPPTNSPESERLDGKSSKHNSATGVTVTKKPPAVTFGRPDPAANAIDLADVFAFQQKGKQPEKKEPAKPAPRVDNRKIIRSGDVDFEVESFDDSVTAITKLVESNGGFVATINSDKLANGKVRGAVVVRVPPEKLDKLLLDLRKELKGDLKGQRIGSQDITKQYTDMESRLKAARTMEERLLRIIKDGKGEIKDLVAAEKELGVWRTKIEELEGEIRYYGNLVSLSTLTVNLSEKEIRLAAAVAERERVQAGIEVEDVEKAYQEALKTIAEFKGRVTRSELKQQAAGQFNAVLHFEVAPESAGPMRDRLRQVGNMVRLEIDTVQQAEGAGKMPLTGKVNRGDTQFQISLYNLANVQPRETVTLKVAATDVVKAFRELRDAIAKVKGRVVNSQLNEQDRQNITGSLEFHIRRDSEVQMQTALTDSGEQLARQVSRVPESDNVTDAKVLFKLELVPATAIPPRETTTLLLEVADVELTLRAFNDEVREAKGRVIQPPEIRQERTGQVMARVLYDVPLSSAPSLLDKFKAVGPTRVFKVTPNPQAPEGKLAVARIEVVLANADLLVPRGQGLWSQVRHGLSTSLQGLSISAGWLIIGLLFVLPWLALLYVGVWVTRKVIRRGAGTSPGA